MSLVYNYHVHVSRKERILHVPYICYRHAYIYITDILYTVYYEYTHVYMCVCFKNVGFSLILVLTQLITIISYLKRVLYNYNSYFFLSTVLSLCSSILLSFLYWAKRSFRPLWPSSVALNCWMVSVVL